MKTRLRKLVALALVLTMLLTVMPASVFAAPGGADEEETVPSTPAVTQEEPAPVEEPAPAQGNLKDGLYETFAIDRKSVV